MTRYHNLLLEQAVGYYVRKYLTTDGIPNQPIILWSKGASVTWLPSGEVRSSVIMSPRARAIAGLSLPDQRMSRGARR